MGLNETPSGERVHIAFFGRRNAGKSSVMNAVTGQALSVVSEVKGTTTDPVSKAMELLPLGPVVMIDTPGIDDEGELGALRVKKSYEVLGKTDTAVLVIDGTEGAAAADLELLRKLEERRIPVIVVWNKTDLAADGRKPGIGGQQENVDEPGKDSTTGKENAAEPERPEKSGGGQLPSSKAVPEPEGTDKARRSQTENPQLPAELQALADVGRLIFVSAKTGAGISELKECLARAAKQEEPKRQLVGDLIQKNDLVILVIPIDKAAPKGRLILPQQQTIRDILERGAYALTVRDTELPALLAAGNLSPKLIITDSQVFGSVSKCVPPEILLTSFSILFARYKGDLETVVRGAAALSQIQDGDRILISEGCTHHRQCGDIGTVKLPGWIREFTGKEPEFHFTSGTEFPEDLCGYKLIVHCGACMLNEREMQTRLRRAAEQGVPMTNYGILIACMKGILKRSVAVFPEIAALL